MAAAMGHCIHGVDDEYLDMEARAETMHTSLETMRVSICL